MRVFGLIAVNHPFSGMVIRLHLGRLPLADGIIVPLVVGGTVTTVPGFLFRPN